jgi:hypothetical protein
VAPETLERWSQARERMMNLIIAARTSGEELPKYKLKKMVFFNEMRVQPQFFDGPTKSMKETLIYWDEVPNEEMVPVNPPAEAIHAEFLNSIGVATIDKNVQPDRPWIRAEKRLFRGMSNDQRQAVYGTPMGDPRVEGHGAPTTGHRVAMLGSVAAPAIVR